MRIHTLIESESNIINKIEELFKCTYDVPTGATYLMPNGKFIDLTYTFNHSFEYDEFEFPYHNMVGETLSLYFKEFDPDYSPAHDLLINKYNFVRLNDAYDDEHCYIQLPPKNLNSNQYESLTKWIDRLPYETYLEVGDEKIVKGYELDDVGTDYVINRIKRFYTSGNLYEGLYSNIPHKGSTFITPEGNYIWSKEADHPELINKLDLDSDAEDIVDEKNWIRADSGLSYSEDGRKASFVHIPLKKITLEQFDALEKWLDVCNGDVFQIETSDGDWIELDMDYYEPNDVINKIKYFYNQGVLKEDIDKNANISDNKRFQARNFLHNILPKLKIEKVDYKNYIVSISDVDIACFIGPEAEYIQLPDNYCHTDLGSEILYNTYKRSKYFDEKLLKIFDCVEYPETLIECISDYSEDDVAVLEQLYRNNFVRISAATGLIEYYNKLDEKQKIAILNFFKKYEEDLFDCYFNFEIWHNNKKKEIIIGNNILDDISIVLDENLNKRNSNKLSEDLGDLNEVYPNKGESKKEFIARFMSVTKKEYPDIKQRFAIANSYWDRRNLKESFSKEYKKFIDSIKSPEELMNWMNKNIDYYLANNDYVDDDPPTQTGEELFNSKNGHCAEQSYLEKDVLDNLGYKTQLVFVKENDSKNDYGYNGSAHMFLIYEKDGKYYWFEHAMEHMRGIHEYNSIDDLLQGVANNWWRYKDESNDKPADLLEVKFIDKPIAGINNKELAKKCYKYPIEKVFDISNNDLEEDHMTENLNESLINEATRGEIISKAKSADKYNDNSKKTRWDKRGYSKVANTVKDYNQLNMDNFWKNDILGFSIRISGETNNYIVGIEFNNILPKIRKNIESNKNKLEIKCIYDALFNALNSNDIKISCTCPDYVYRLKYYNSQKNIQKGEKENRKSIITNPNDTKGPACKHILAALNNVEWLRKIASVINNYINYCKDNMELNYAKYIFPKLYGVSYDKAVQLTMNDYDENGKINDKLKSDESLINLANALGKVRGRFKKGSNKNPTTVNK